MRPAGSDASAPSATTEHKPWFAERQATTDRGKTPLAWAPTQLAAPSLPAPVVRRTRWRLVGAIGAIGAIGLLAGLGVWRLRAAPPAPAPAAAAATRGPRVVADATLAPGGDPWGDPPPRTAPFEPIQHRSRACRSRSRRPRSPRR